MDKFLPEELREKVIEYCSNEKENICFGDGQNIDYCRNGFPIFRGYNNYTDEELILELISGIGPDDRKH